MVKQVVAYGLVAGLVSFSSTLLLTSEAQAFRTASIDGKICRVEGKNPHYHLGVGRYFASEKDASDHAIAKWTRFVVREYGSAFGDLNLAEHKNIDCALGASGHNWACAVKAQPCRPE